MQELRIKIDMINYQLYLNHQFILTQFILNPFILTQISFVDSETVYSWSLNDKDSSG
jgi:hypothetical protein